MLQLAEAHLCCHPYSDFITRHDLYEGSTIADLGSSLSSGGNEGLTS